MARFAGPLTLTDIVCVTGNGEAVPVNLVYIQAKPNY
jgi:hypothetical protein